jgi:hypothetical protein
MGGSKDRLRLQWEAHVGENKPAYIRQHGLPFCPDRKLSGRPPSGGLPKRSLSSCASWFQLSFSLSPLRTREPAGLGREFLIARAGHMVYNP